ncbi:nickel/cobalt transporter [Marinospirillum alkaliphilum]|uniref:Nickel/cobalt efflux system n=1 Tax=Marinospirillum alkaliphilum DSM 21637 TaxID=1122209 RepID=A0A1K1WUI3_9GAMM|nr:nickel/cobalt transporter [Marinospirillum alkaliphilum]SFX40628.1 ABC-type nickel/cobalt efflux system, permease component RcnA [Marinospirillum alkaliphilum DSM 21637]
MTKPLLLLWMLLLSSSLLAAPLPGLPAAERTSTAAVERVAPSQEAASLRNQWQQLTFWILQKQREYHRALADGIEKLSEQGSWQHGWALLVLSFFYGVFHAAGPGHGKAVLTTYLLTQPEKLRRGLLLSFLAAMLQGLTAILLVTVLVHGLGRLAREAFSSVLYVEMASFALVALMGCWLIWRGARQLLNHLRQQPVTRVDTPLVAQTGFTPVQQGSMHITAFTPVQGGSSLMAPAASATPCPSCGKVHHVAPEQVEGKSWWEQGGLLLSIGLRPCSGAVLVLVVANLLGLWWIGVLSAMAMALGTALTVGLLATLAVQARNLAQRLSRLQGRRLFVFTALLAVLGGLFILLLGSSLLLGSLATDHPLGLF